MGELFKDHVFFLLKQPINHSQVVTLNDCQLSPLQDRAAETEKKKGNKRRVLTESQRSPLQINADLE